MSLVRKLPGTGSLGIPRRRVLTLTSGNVRSARGAASLGFHGRQPLRQAEPERKGGFLRIQVLAVFIGITVASAACKPEASWSLEAPGETPILAYAMVPDTERETGVVYLDDDSVIASTEDELGGFGFNILGRNLDVDSEERVYALDEVRMRVLVYDTSANLIRTFGGPGKGPGEFDRPLGLFVAGDRVYVHQADDVLSAWDLNGRFVRDTNVSGGALCRSCQAMPMEVIGLDSGSLLVASVSLAAATSDASSFETWTLLHLAPDGKVLHAFMQLPWPRLVLEGRSVWGTTILKTVRVPMAQPKFAANRTGETYITTGREYEILALSPQGTRWLLRVPTTKQPLPDGEIEGALRAVRRQVPGVRRSDVQWPEDLPALRDIVVDGHGHLYVFPTTESVRSTSTIGRPVDVYDSAGTRIYAGFINGRPWIAARGDYVYYTTLDSDTRVPTILRRRLREPF